MPVRCSNEFLHTPEKVSGEGPGSQMVLVLGSELCPNRSKLQAAHIRKSWRLGHQIIGIEKGVLAIAEAGILKGRCFALQRDLHDALILKFPELSPAMAALEFDGTIATCAGGFATADLVLALVENHHGKIVRAFVEDDALCISLRKSSDPDRPYPLKTVTQSAPVLAGAIAYIDSHLDEYDLLTRMAKATQISRRQLERMFAEHLQTTPLKFVTNRRLDKALRLMSVSQGSMLDIALDCGFGSRASFSKAFKKRHGVTPDKYI